MIITFALGIAVWIATFVLGGDTKRTLWIGAGLITVGTLLINLASPFTHLADSRYMLLTSDTLIHDGHWHIEEFFPDFEAERQANPASHYQVYHDGEHIHYSYPPGGVLLSVPAVLIGRLFDYKVVRGGEYQFHREVQLQRVVAGLLMALMTGLVFLTARMMLPHRTAAMTALAAGLASPAWSELSRTLWIDTWGALLIAVAVFMLTRWVMRDKPLHPLLLATVISWAFFVKPTYALPAAAVFAFVALRQWRMAIPMAITGAVWLGLFVAHNLWVFGYPLHFYFFIQGHDHGFQINGALARMAGHLISPSRGLFIFIPWLFLIPLAWALGKREQPSRSLGWLALVNLVIPLILMSGWVHWWGGHSFGPRLFGGTIPWMALLLMHSLSSLRERRWVLPVLGVLIALGVFIHAQGAIRGGPRQWNSEPESIDTSPERLWDWKDPQFLR